MICYNTVRKKFCLTIKMLNKFKTKNITLKQLNTKSSINN